MAVPTTTTLGLPLGTRPASYTKLTPELTGTLRLYAIGDSITHGGANESTGNTGRSWRQYVAEMLTEAGISYTIVGSLSSASTTWPNHLAAIGLTIDTMNTNAVTYFGDATPSARIITADPDIVICAPFGFNDLGGGAASGATTLTRWTTLMEEFRAYTNGRGVTPRIVVGYVYNGSNSAYDSRIADFNAGLDAAIATQEALGQKFVKIDPRKLFQHESTRPVMLVDGTHPGDRGFRIWADDMFAAIMACAGKDPQWGRPTS